jgi:hypothetical protein
VEISNSQPYYKRPLKDSVFAELCGKIFGQAPYLNVIIAGGCARKLFFDLDWGKEDVDVWFKTKSDVDIIDSNIRRNITNNLMIFKTFDTINAETYNVEHYTFQFMKKQFNSCHDLLNNFDFTISQFYTDGLHVYCSPLAYSHACQKILDLNPTFQKPVKISRVKKYCDYGFTPTYKVMKNILDNSVVDTNNYIINEVEDEY